MTPLWILGMTAMGDGQHVVWQGIVNGNQQMTVCSTGEDYAITVGGTTIVRSLSRWSAQQLAIALGRDAARSPWAHIETKGGQG